MRRADKPVPSRSEAICAPGVAAHACGDRFRWSVGISTDSVALPLPLAGSAAPCPGCEDMGSRASLPLAPIRRGGVLLTAVSEPALQGNDRTASPKTRVRDLIWARVAGGRGDVNFSRLFCWCREHRCGA